MQTLCNFSCHFLWFDVANSSFLALLIFWTFWCVWGLWSVSSMAKGECVGIVVMAWSMNTTVPWRLQQKRRLRWLMDRTRWNLWMNQMNQQTVRITSSTGTWWNRKEIKKWMSFISRVGGASHVCLHIHVLHSPSPLLTLRSCYTTFMFHLPDSISPLVHPLSSHWLPSISKHSFSL